MTLLRRTNHQHTFQMSPKQADLMRCYRNQGMGSVAARMPPPCEHHRNYIVRGQANIWGNTNTTSLQYIQATEMPVQWIHIRGRSDGPIH